jgi:hypothetical protein
LFLPADALSEAAFYWPEELPFAGKVSMDKAQGAFEYILLVTGMVMIVLLVVMTGLSSTRQANNAVNSQLNSYNGIIGDLGNMTLPDLFVAGEGAGCSSPQASVTVGNKGKVAASNVEVRLYAGDGTSTVATLSGALNPNQYLSTGCVDLGTTSSLAMAIADPMLKVRELNENNNQWTKS